MLCTTNSASARSLRVLWMVMCSAISRTASEAGDASSAVAITCAEAVTMVPLER